MKTFIAITGIAGLALASGGAWNLKRSEAGIRYHHNPFALHESAYGKLLAELSQDTVDQIWHIGIEQVNPDSHSHEGHDHGPGEDCETCKKADEANTLLDSVTTSDSDDHSGHDHAAHDDHSGHDHAAHDDHSGHDHAAHDDHDDHAGHVHDEHCGHDHGVSLTEAITNAKDFLVDLKSARYERTNPQPISEAHRLQIAGEIETMLLRSYKMDPTNYGVYNAYYLFLTSHELRSTPAAFDQARLISRTTIGRAQLEDTAPSAWLTAEMALLNMFLLDQADWRKQGIEPPLEALLAYRDQSAYCKQNYQVLKQRAIAEGRWKTISAEKRDEMETRERFAEKTFATTTESDSEEGN